jgi:major membrane immunogen (membrane-anchored lipoprotein)
MGGNKMLSRYLAIACVSVVLLTGCSREDDASSTIPLNESAFKEHVEALEKAKGVEQMMLNGAESRNQTIEEQSR